MSENRYLEINLTKFSHISVILLTVLTYVLSMKVLTVHDSIYVQQNNIGDLSAKARKLLIEECAVQQKKLQKQIEEPHEEDAEKSSEEGDF